MPGKTKSGKKSTDGVALKKISASVIKQIWNQIDFQDWMSIVQTANPDGRWKGVAQGIKGRCPFHDDRDPSFVIDLKRGHAKCFSSECGKYFWDPVRFYAELQPFPLSFPNALKELKDKFDIRVPKNAIAQINKRFEHREMKRVLYAVMNGELCDAHTYLSDPNPKHPPPQDITYAKDTLLYLQRRGIKPVYHCLPIGIMPARMKLEQRVKQYAQTHQIKDYWDDIVEYLDSVIDGTWIGGLVFFTGDSPNDPCKLKFRRVPLHGVLQADPKEFVYIPDPMEEHNGIFGLFGTRYYFPLFAAHDIKSFHFFEGEFDVLTILSEQVTNNHVGFMAFSGGGSSTTGLDPMARYGFDVGYVVGDDDKAGEEWAKPILEGTVHVKPRVFRWPDALKIQGRNDVDPDLAVRHFGMEAFEAEMRKEENFQMPHTWAMSRAKKEMSGAEADDVRQLTRIAADWGLYVRNPAERHAYVTALCSEFKLSAGQIHNEINAGNDNEEAFIERIRSTLEGRLHVLQRRKEGNSHILRVWDKASDDIIDLHIGEKHRILSAIEAMSGKDIYKWIYEEVGDPGFLMSYEEAKNNNSYIKQAKLLVDYVAAAVSRLGASLPVMSDVRFVKEGLHCVAPSLDTTAKPGDFRIYLVNGTDLFRGEFDHGNKLTWSKMDGPSDGHVVVKADGEIRPQKVYSQIKTVEDLHKEPIYKPKELYEIVLEMLRLGWDFKNHYVSSDFMAALTLLCAISDCIPRQPMVMLTANQSSGKTCLLGGFLGGSSIPRINVLQSSLFMDNYTVAGVKQSMNASAIALCLDEFEDKGGNDRKSQIVRALLTFFRGLTNEIAITIQGSASGRHETFRFHCPVILAGIRTFSDPADISRYTFIEMDSKTSRESPVDILGRAFGEKKIREIREQLPLVMFRLAKDVYDAYFEIQQEYQSGGDLEFGGITRSREGLYGVMAVMKAVGRDYRRFAEEFFRANKLHFQQLTSISISNDMFQELLFIPAIDIQDVDDPRPKTLNDILSSGNPEIINNTPAGVYYDRQNNWIVVHWTQAQAYILRNSQFRGYKTYQLQTQAQRSPYAIPKNQVLASDVLQRLSPYMGKLADPNAVTVYNVKDYTVDVQARHAYTVRGIETLDLEAQYAERLAQKQFAEPPKNDENDGTRTSKAAVARSDVTPKSIDDDFNY